MSPKVSVIVPIYNAEKYIEKCIRTLFEQTLDDIEYIFVNDCTPDNSMKILEEVLHEYPHRKPRVKIFHHEHNQGQAGARTTGMKAMTGEYMIHCDPDDWVELNMYETMYNKAKDGNFDIVTCNWILETQNKKIYQKTTYASTPIESLAQCKYNPSLWNKLIRTQIIKHNNIYPYSFINCGEDLNIIIRTLFYSQSICTIDIHPYHYRQNEQSITHQDHKRLFYESHKPNVEKLCSFLATQGNKEFVITQMYIKFIEKYGLINKSCCDYKTWSKTWPECHKYIKYFPLPRRYKQIMSLCANHPILLNIYYKYLRWRTK